MLLFTKLSLKNSDRQVVIWNHCGCKDGPNVNIQPIGCNAQLQGREADSEAKMSGEGFQGECSRMSGNIWERVSRNVRVESREECPEWTVRGGRFPGGGKSADVQIPCTQDYRSLPAAVMICFWHLFGLQTDTQTACDQLLTSRGWAKIVVS